jgi:hypothetical protein
MITDISFMEGKTQAILHGLAFMSILTMFLLIGLSILIIKARPSSAENRFMSVLLGAEAIKVIEAWYNVYPVGAWILPYVEYYRVLTFFAIVLSILMYLSMCSFYPVRGLGFMTAKKIRENLWWALPVVSASIIALLVTSAGGVAEAFGGVVHVLCPEGSSNMDAVLTAYPAELTLDAGCLQDDGYLPYSFIAPQNTEISRLLFLTPVLIAGIAMLMMRSSWKSLAKESKNEAAEEARALFIGFAGKTAFKGGLAVSMIAITVKFGEFNPADVASITDKNLLFLYLVNIYAFLFSILFTGMFEGILFTYAILKREVLGIDERLRKTFTASVLGGVGAVLILVTTELMEDIIGVGWLGGVLIGILFITLRKPLVGLIDGLSTSLMPKSFTEREQNYLEAFALAMEQGAVGETERKLLQMQAKALQLKETRTQYLEQCWLEESSE